MGQEPEVPHRGAITPEMFEVGVQYVHDPTQPTLALHPSTAQRPYLVLFTVLAGVTHHFKRNLIPRAMLLLVTELPT